MTQRRPRARILGAYLALCFIWGSTYLAIRIAVETLPPLLMVGVRVIFAGSILYGWARMRGAQAPPMRAWREALVIGTLLFLGGQGGLAWAEQYVPSSMASIVFATIPLWMALLTGARLRDPRTLLGLGLGFLGVVVLATGDGEEAGFDPVGVGMLVVATVAWCVGSVRGRDRAKELSSFPALGMQLIAGGVVLLVVGSALGELGALAEARVSGRSILALFYLGVVGSLLGFSMYAWLLRVEEPHRVATYAYVNPLVAIGLGALAGEPLTPRLLIAGATVIVSVALVLHRPRTDELRSAMPRQEKAWRNR